MRSHLPVLIVLMVSLCAIAQPGDPISLRGTLDTPGESVAVALDDKIAVLTEIYSSRFDVVDITDKDDPVLVGSLVLSGNTNDLDLDRINNIAYVAAGQNGVYIVDYSTLNSPFIAGHIPMVQYADGVRLDPANNLLYVAEYYRSWQIYDVSSGTSGVLLYENMGRGDYRDVDERDGLLYVVADTGGLEIYDVSEPAQPLHLSTLSLPHIAYDVIAADNGFAYVAGWQEGIHVIDANDPENPVLIGSVNVPGNVRSIRTHVGGSHIGAVSQSAGLYIFNISAGGWPILTGNHDTPANARTLEVGAEYAYITDGPSFRIYELGDSLDDLDTVNLDGHVTDTVTNLPIEDVSVYVTWVEAFTDSDGYYLVEGIIPDTYWVRLSHPAYSSQYHPAIVVPEGGLTQDFQLDPNIIRGQITDGDTDQPVEGALVSITGSGGTFIDSTDSNGLYGDLLPVPVGQYTVTVTHPGYETIVSGPYTVETGTTVIDLELTSLPDIQLILEPDDWPVVIPPQGGQFGFTGTIYTSPDLPVGQYRIKTTIEIPPGGYVEVLSAVMQLGPGQTRQAHLTQVVPQFAWSGVYLYRGVVTTMLNVPLAADSFPFSKQAPQGNMNTEVRFPDSSVDWMK